MGGGAAPLRGRHNFTPAQGEAAGGSGPSTGGSESLAGSGCESVFAEYSWSDFNGSGQEGHNSPSAAITAVAGRRVAAPATLPAFRGVQAEDWAPWAAA